MPDDKREEILPLLSELDIAVAIDACRRAGAVNASVALSKHISRLQVELDLLRRRFDALISKTKEKP